MTVANLPASVDYFENGATLAFAAPFRFKSAGDLVVTRYFASGTITPLVLGVDYTVTGGSTDAGGTVTITAAAVTGTRLRIKRVTARSQASDYTTGDRFPAELTEQTFDTAMLIDQEQDVAIAELQARALLLPVGEIAGDLPPLTGGEGRVLGVFGGKFVWAANNAAGVAGDLSLAQAAAVLAQAQATAATAALAQVITLVGQNPRRVTKTTDTQVVSSTALITDPDLVVPLAANASMLLRAHINFSASAAGDFKWRHTGPAAPTSLQLNRKAIAPGDTAYTGIAIDTAYSVADITVLGAAGSGVVEFEATILNGVNAGNFAFQFAQNTSDATASIVKANSYIEYIPLPGLASGTYAGTSIAFIGEFTPTVGGGHNYLVPQGNPENYVDTVVTGFKCEVQVFGPNNYTFQVDGGTPTVVAVPAGGWQFATAFNGLSDTPHRLKITNGPFFDQDLTLRVAGLAPAIARPSDTPNYFKLGAAPFTTYGAVDAFSALSSNIYGATYQQRLWNLGGGFGLRFKATTTSVCVFMYGFNNRIVLKQDGAIIADVTVLLTNHYSVVTLATGLSGSHEYEICTIYAGTQTFMYGILVDAIDTVTHAAKALDAYYGDSIVAGTAAGVTYDSRLVDAYILANSLGRTAIRVGAAGTRVVNYGRDNTLGITGLPQAPTRVFVGYGVNDMQAYTAPADITAFQAAYQTMLSNIRTGLPAAKIYARGILPVAASIANSAQRGAYNTAIAAAVTAIGDANIVYRSTDGWIDPTVGVDTIEGLHPNTSGYAKIAAAQALVL